MHYKITELDPWLEKYADDIALRMWHFNETRFALLDYKTDLSTFANGYMYFGFSRTNYGWVYREWAPGADAMHLIGDFNNWNRGSHPMTRLDNGVWEIKLEGRDALKHGQKVKVQVSRNGRSFDLTTLIFVRLPEIFSPSLI